MKMLKKVFCVSFSLVLIACCSWEGKALFGNTHYMIGEKIVKKMEKNLTEEERLAFLSGMVYADIGRLKFDNLCGVKSDSRDFLERLQKNAATDQEKWFVKGVEMHILQDEMTSEFLLDCADDYPSYVVRCSLIDYYFLRSSGSYIYSEFLESFDLSEISSLTEYKDLCKAFKIPEEQVGSVCKFIFNQYYRITKRSSLISCDDLLIKTYSDLNLEVTKEELHQQQANMIGAFIITAFMVGNKQEISKSLIDVIEEKSEKIANVCVEHIKFS